MNKRVFLAVALLMVSACENPGDTVSCVLGEENYLKDADFSLEAQSSRSKHWTGVQHAGEKSFVVSFAEGVASLEKVGSQPWFIYRQRLRSADLAGQLMAFSSELRLIPQAPDAAESVGRPGGLLLSVVFPSGKMKLLAEQRLAANGTSEDWQLLQLIASLPHQAEVVELSVIHESGGILQVRSPSLRQVDLDSHGCALTPPL